MILLSHPTGNANVRAVLTGLLDAGLLGQFRTTVATFPGNLWDILGRSKWGTDFQRRKFEARLQPLTVQQCGRELGRMLAARFKIRPLTRHETGCLSTDAIYKALDAAVARVLRADPQHVAGVYAYEDGALQSFRAALELGMHRFYDLPIAYCETAQRLLHEEAERLPGWKPTLGGTRDSAAKLARKAEELDLAQTVFCPSAFVANSLPIKVRANKSVIVAPFGSPPLGSEKPQSIALGKKLRVLFVGSMTQRKGLGDLFTAMRTENRHDVELIVLGAPQAPMEFYRKEFSGFTYEPGRSHSEVLELMRSCDVFCLPSIVEGRALVMQEAMSQGLPLVITVNTGGEDLIEEGQTGFLVPIRRPDQIAEKIAWFASHRAKLPEMSRAAQSKAAELTWKMYGRTIAQAVLDRSDDGKETIGARSRLN